MLGSLRRERLEILLFDAKEERGNETSDAPPVGRASIPLSSLSDGDSIVGGFDLRSLNGNFAGKVHVSIRWRVPLKPGGNYNERAVLNEQQVRFLLNVDLLLMEMKVWCPLDVSCALHCPVLKSCLHRTS